MTALKPAERAATGGTPGGPASRFPAVTLWWLSPVAVTLFIGTVAVVLTAAVGDADFRRYWDEPKLVTTETLVLFECGVLAFALAALIATTVAAPRTGLTGPWPNLSPATERLLRRASTVLTTLTLAGYLGFAIAIARSGLSLAELFGDVDNPWDAPVKIAIGTIPGVTTLTQVGMAAATVSSVLLAQRFTRAELARLVTVLTLSVPRAYIYSERLALLELAVPAVVVGAAWLSNRSRRQRAIAKATPVAGLAVVGVLFAVFEYFRSWQFYRQRGDMSFWEFAANRLAGYYATAINNGQVILDHLAFPGRLPFDTLDAFWSLQGVYQLRLYEVLGGHDRPYAKSGDEESPYFHALAQAANPEFNNPSGYVAPFVDYGPVGGLMFFALIGVVTGLLYRAFASGHLVGLLVYPFVFTGFVELPRYLYWFQGRCTYSWLALAVVLVLAAVVRRRERRRELLVAATE
ncbi:Uncharacterised protein [Mycolicibacterium phlei]|jgi:hypothetical protein|uniref:Oligosaccharide repeat unit polymerase n=1 Tax=Mycolicibacterium phlei DSM 43239 = CCUG 21000 TaxID=1226750 RepID=A0A5N5UQ69_MYCPH|nr:oligosaccharide repeat unit polymerase [Mycolicibacterium phlei]VEG08171.1 Uncharacterised protein [Mycobacteroides chelonae]AMO60049.1 hypothetical protein MPHLCCUG_01223 [Mycolicibacterium phlei]KAB7751713.1 hypothetical protein MPHL21000_23350 [Mycolicibacterium phlei DSM 43239 = CCUG 21000]KXW60298.1 hypothetical protein MPHL43239_25070 [Mycolicibacterium phlei DSM 43239 = CCUG 21000]KXW65945.1 hypothetical protein MPHL43070_21415 [Mycolicibacterium phlei DSM 43070]